VNGPGSDTTEHSDEKSWANARQYQVSLRLIEDGWRGKKVLKGGKEREPRNFRSRDEIVGP